MKAIFLALVLALPLSSFAEGVSTQAEQTGVVESVFTVNARTANSGDGAKIGSMVGAAIGISRNSGGFLRALGGALVGSIVGAVTEDAVRYKDELEINVLLDNGGRIAVKQDTGELFTVGDQVRVLSDGSHVTRVSN